METLLLVFSGAAVLCLLLWQRADSKAAKVPVLEREIDGLKAELAALSTTREALCAELLAELTPLRAELLALRIENGDLKRQRTRAKWTAEAPPLMATDTFDRTLGNEHNLNNWD